MSTKRPPGWTVVDEIKMLRRQMLVHSAIYYELNDTLIDDHEWQRRANRLAHFQKKYPHPVGVYDAAFEGWDGSTGYHLPIRDPWVVDTARKLLRQRDKQAFAA